jgi:hypothetical protein
MDRVDHNNAFVVATSICGVVVASAATMMDDEISFFFSFFAQSRPQCRQQQLAVLAARRRRPEQRTRTEVHRKLSHPALTGHYWIEGIIIIAAVKL